MRRAKILLSLIFRMLMRSGLLLMLLVLASSCNPKENDPQPGDPGGSSDNTISLRTDKVNYAPGNTIHFSLGTERSNLNVKYKYLGEVIGEQQVNGDSWQWTAPAEDFRGYLVEVYDGEGNDQKLLGTIGVDVSSDWSRFPRYGFLSKYPSLEQEAVNTVIDNLARHHINGLQFYDWHYQHHQPLAGTVENPEPVYQDIIGRDIYLKTVKDYIARAHDFGMQAMQYNLVFGALKNASSDGVKPEWYLFEDKAHTTINKHPLPQPPFVSDIYLTNPANPEWQAYLANENDKVYQALDFDGYHMDQLGDRGTALYTYNAAKVELPQTFEPFIKAMHQAHPDKYLVMNAVNQYGQPQIADAPVDFLYTEVWDPNNTYKDLADIILNNLEYSNGTKNSVLAAYMNYQKADQSGVFNTPGVLLTDAVIFAFGGAHLELGEHMLAKEYFPNDNLVMRKDLREALVSYYDFMVAYQNLLRDGGTFNQPEVSTFSQVSLSNWPPRTGSVSMVGKEVGSSQVLHLINFSNANNLLWRDTGGTQPYPDEIKTFELKVAVDKPVDKIWFASPDIDGGASRELEFTQTGNHVSFTIPTLKYWDMVVIQYQL